ncbi:YadA-like family protein [Veillonella sp. CHU110]|uniref:YadA-like family protein n=1 Tax=Veillonella sp. CHU110 TaxID=2490947 RepID=UPI000F8EFFF2|nr:YadA-like family protein [Veillonella sp. CHU110]
MKADGAPDIQRDAEGNPTNGYTIADDGNIYPSNQMNFIQQPDGSKTMTPRGGTKPTTLNTNLVNPNVTHSNPTAGVNTPTTVGNVNNGAAIFNPISTTGVPLRQAIDGKWYEATKVDEQGNKLPDADAFEGTPAVLANDGKWYEAGKVDAKGTPKADAQPIANPLTNKIANGGLINFANSNPNNVATVGDLQNMGWIVGAPGNNYADQVRNANQVNFIGTNGVSVTGETNTDGIRTVTIDVHEQKTVEAAHTPVVYTDGKGNKLTKLDNGKFYDAQETAALGPKVKEVDGRLYPADALEVDGKYYPADTIFIDGKPYPKGSIKHDDGSITNPRGLDYKALDGVAPVTDAKASMNDTEGSTTNPFPLANVGSNLKQVVDPKEKLPGKVNDKDGETKVGDVTNTAPYTAQEAATMTQRYELNADGTIKTEKVPVIDRETGKQKVTKTKEIDPQTGLETEVETPVFEDKKVINANYIGNNAATVSDVLNTGWNLQNNGDARDFVKPYDTVNFVNGANTTAMVTTSEDGSTSKVTFNVTGLPVTYTDTDGKPVSKVGDKFYKVNDKGEPISDTGKPAVKTNNDGKLVDEDDHVIEPIDPAATPLKTALTNPAPAKDKTSTTSPTALNNVTSNLSNYTEPVKNALRNLDNENVSNNTAATVGDLRNMGWIVSSDKKTDDLGNAYSEAVKNANEVKFVGTGAAVVSGKTADDGVRTITVSVDNQVATNNSVTPVVYTKADGTQVYPTNQKDEQGRPIFNTKADGNGEPVQSGDVVTSVNGPNGTKGENAPTTLKNVKNNIPNVNDGTEEITHPDGTVDSKTPNKANITKAPLTAAKAAELSNPKTADGAVNPNYIGNNAATVSDVLNAGWNLQNNGAAKDFVKPFDTVNFVNGGNTTAVVTTNAEGTASDVTYNVTGLPVTYTTETGAPVSKVGDKFYTVDESGTPVGPTGKKAVGKNATGDFIDDAGNVITPINITEKPLQSNLVNPNVKNTNDAPNNQTTTPTQLGNVANGAKTFAPLAADGTEATDAKPAVKLANDGKWYPADQVEPNGKPKENATPVAGPVNVAKSGLIDFTNSNPNNAATIGDLQNMGWVVSAEGNSYSDQVRNANEVKFVGEGKAVVTGKTDANGVRTITVKVEDQDVNHDALPVVYTKADGTQVYPVKSEDGTITYHTTPNGKGDGDQEVQGADVVTSVNGPNGTKGENAPTTLKNVKNNIPNVNDESKTITNPDGKEKPGAGDVANINKAPLTAEEAAKLSNPKTADGAANPNYIGNNAATVSDVLNAGWNLQGNGKAVDFVKPFDTVNFRDGGNTTVTVTTDDNLTSHVQVNVTGLPVANTITDPTTGKQVPVVKVGDTFYPANPDGTPNIEKNDKGEPTNGYVRADDGKFYPREDVDVTPAADPTKSATVTPKEGKTPTTVNTNLANPNVANTTDNPGNNVNTPSQLGNVANGANTFSPVDADGNEYVKANNGKYYAPDKVNEDGSLKEGTDAVADAKDPLVLANDGKWYKSSEVQPNGTPIDTATSVQPPTNTDAAGLVDFSKSNPNNAATVGDLQNLGWIVSAEGNDYTDQVRNANEVRFVGAGSATVTGETDKNGVRTITVSVDDQVSTNNAITPVNYTTADGTKVYPLTDEDGNVTYHTTSDGTGDGDQVIAPDNVITSLNGPKGTKSPTTLNNVKNNIPAVNDADKKVTNPDGTEAPNAGDVANINKAPLTAEKAADLLNPKTKDGKANPNFAGNNAATVSDVLNAGWNLQNNGTAKDFVKPFDTVNFVNGGNTTAVVTTKADGTTSDVTFNVTGLPIATTITDPTTGKQVPVVKVGDTFYPANPDGTPNIARNDKGEPTNGYVRANDGKLYPREAVTVTPSADPTKPPTVTPNADVKPTTVNTNLANPNVDNTTNEPGNNVNTPTQLGNVANGANTFAPKNADGDVLAKGNDGKWYKAADLTDGKPNAGAPEQTVAPKADNVDKAGLVDFNNSNPNNAATVGDLQNLGFVVSAKDNGYTDQVRNANKVEFKGTNGVEVTGKTLEDGTREITVGLKEGKVTNDVIVTKEDGTETHAVRGEDGKIYEKDPVTGKATTTEIPVGPKDTVKNDGDSFVNGNAVATAIQKSGWNIGIGSTDKAFSTDAKIFEKVNPNDNVKYVNGANTTVSMAVDEAEDKDGTKVTTTYVKVDVNRDLKIDSVTAGGPAKDGVPGKDGAMTVKDAAGKDGVSATAKDGKGTLTLNNAKAGKDGNNAASVAISTDKAPADLDNTPKDAVRANDGKWYAPADVDVKTKDGKTVVTPKAGKSPMADAPTMDRIQYKGTDGKLRDVATMDDGLRFQGDDGESISKPLNSTVQLTGGNRADTGKPVAKEATTTGNIGVFNADGKLSVQLAKDLGALNSANFESKTDKAGNPVTMIDGKYYKATDLENGKPKTGAKPVEGDNLKGGPNSKLTGTGLVVTPETAKVVNPKTGEVIVDPTKVVSFGAPSIAVNPNTGKTMVDANGNPVMKSGISAGGQVIANVAPGVENTDAVNVSQLKGVTNAVVNISNHVNGLGAQMNRVGAQAAAMAGLRHLQYDPLEPTTIMAGVGTYKGEGALALGIAHYKNESTLFHAGASIGSRGDELMANAGVSWKFGARADETAVKDTFRQGPISASYTLQDKVSALEAQNQMQKDEINTLKAQLAEVLQYIKKG